MLTKLGFAVAECFIVRCAHPESVSGESSMARYTLIAAPNSPTSGDATTASTPIICDVNANADVAAPSAPGEFEVRLGDAVTVVKLLDLGPPILFTIDGRPQEVVVDASGEYRTVGSGLTFRLGSGRGQRGSSTSSNGSLLAPMPGRVVKVLCEVGSLVEAGTPLVVLEAMKMENELVAPTRGRVQEVFIREGSAVEARAKLVVLAEA